MRGTLLWLEAQVETFECVVNCAENSDEVWWIGLDDTIVYVHPVPPGGPCLWGDGRVVVSRVEGAGHA